MNEGMNEHANELKNQAFDEIIDQRIIDALCDRIMSVLRKQDLPLGVTTAHLEAAMYRLLGSFAVARMCNVSGKCPDIKVFTVLSNMFRQKLEERYSPLVKSFEPFVKIFLSGLDVPGTAAESPAEFPLN